MGCGTSINNSEPKRTNKEEYDEMMGKILPTVIIIEKDI